MKIQSISILSPGHHLMHGCAIIVSALTVASAVYGFWILRSERVALEQEQRTLTSLVRNERNVRLKHGRLAEQMKSTVQSAKNGLRGAPKPNDAEFFAEVSQLARKEKLIIKSYSPGQLSNTGLQLQITATGSYSDIVRFLDGLQTISFLCELSQCAIIAPQQTTKPCEIELTIQLLNPEQVWPKLAQNGNP